MAVALTKPELQLAEDLAHAGLTMPAAVLAVALATREHARPEPELRDIVRQYQHLETPDAVADALTELRSLGWVTETDSYLVTLLHQSPNLRQKITDRLGRPEVAEQLLALRSYLEPSVRIVGTMRDADVYTSFLKLLGSARSEICLPMLATTPNLAAVPILQEKARRGVAVKIVLGAPQVVANLRGGAMEDVARTSIREWKRHAKGLPRMQIRIAHRADDLAIATCMCIDRSLLRFDVYDHEHQRSLQGTLVEVSSDDSQLNLVRVFLRFFDQVWADSRPTGVFPKARWWLSRGWQWQLFFAFSLAASLSVHHTLAFAITASAASAFLVNAVADSRASIQRFIRARR